MTPYFCLLKVVLTEPVSSMGRGTEPAEKPVIGYYRSVGVTAPNRNEAIALFAEIVSDGQIDWQQSKFLEFEQLEKSIAGRYTPSGSAGCWYLSGRALFQGE